MRVELRTCTVDLDTREVRQRGGGEAALTEQEAALLRWFVDHPRRLVGRQELLEEVMGWASKGPTRAVDAAMSRLRQKVDQGDPPQFVTVRGEGYRFDPGGLPAGELWGREAEEATLARYRTEGRGWITVAGAPGIGKTALVRAALRDASPAVVDLSAARSWPEALELLASAISASSPSAASVGAALAARGDPLWLDQADPVLDVLVADVSAWVARGVRVWLTALRPAGAPGEAVLRLGPLPEDAAAALFLARARAAEPGWAADPETVRAIGAALDHHPLALQLAAARAPVLTAGELLAALDDRLALLRRPRTAGRHASLREAIEWAWSLTPDDLRQALAAWSWLAPPLAAADAAEVAGIGVADARDRLQRLIESGLARRVEDAAGRSRYRIEANVAGFARDPSAGMPERVRRWALERGERLATALETDLGALASLRDHAPNLRAAMLSGGPPEDAVRAVRALDTLADVGGQVIDRLALLDRGLSAGPDAELLLRRGEARRQHARPADARADLEAARALVGDTPGVRLLDAVLHADRGDLDQAEALLGDLPVEGQAGLIRGRLRAERDDVDGATACFREVRARARASGAWWPAMMGALRLGLMERTAGRLDAARPLYDEALALARAAGAGEVEAKIEMNRCGLAAQGGDLAGALVHAERALGLHRRAGALHLEVMAMSTVGALRLALGRPAEALPLLLEAVDRARDRGDRRDLQAAAGNLGRCRQELGDADGAAEAFAAAIEEGPESPQRGWWAVHATATAAARGRPDEARRWWEVAASTLAADDPWLRLATAHLRLAEGDRAGAAALAAALGDGDDRTRSIQFVVLSTELPLAIARLRQALAR